MFPGDWFYTQAFWELSTERQIGMGLGPIPASRIKAYAADYGLEPDVAEVFKVVVREMDSVYLSWSAEEGERKRKARQEAPRPSAQPQVPRASRRTR